jgi:hypothetical protein
MVSTKPTLFHHKFIMFLGLMILTTFIYWPDQNGQFIWDDNAHIVPKLVRGSSPSRPMASYEAKKVNTLLDKGG